MFLKLAALFVVTSASLAAHAACLAGKLTAGDARLRAAPIASRAATVASAVLDACHSDLPTDLRVTLERFSKGDAPARAKILDDELWRDGVELSQTVEEWLVAHGAGKRRAHRWARELALPKASPGYPGGGIAFVHGDSETIELGDLKGTLFERAASGAARPAAPDGMTVRGSLDREAIGKVVQRHFDEVRSCYDSDATNAGVPGKVMVQFTVGGTGHVVASVVQSSTVGSPDVEECVVAAVKGWVFPKPANDGIAIVSYPFVFGPPR